MNWPASIRYLFISLALLVLVATNGPYLDRLPFDHHGFRQTQTLTTIDLFHQDGIDLLYPRTNYCGEPGYLVLEFPLFQAACAWLYKLFGPHLVLVRILNILITLASAQCTYWIAQRLFNVNVAVLSFCIYVTAPLNLMFMSSTLFDPTGILFGLLTLYSALKAFSNQPNAVRWRTILAICAILTAVLKALYLFPVLVYFVFDIWHRKEKLRDITARLLLLVPAGVCFLVWSYHCSRANGLSYFTSGLEPSSLLGWSRMLHRQWFVVIAKRLLWECAGPIAGVAALTGWCWSLFQVFRPGNSGQSEKWILWTGATAIGYWVSFANINFPHNYYSLVAVPFISIGAAAGLSRALESRTCGRWMPSGPLASAALVLALCFSNGAYFALRRGFPEDPVAVKLRQVIGRKLAPGSFGIIFVGETLYPQTKGADVPTLLYAARLRGSSKVVKDQSQALSVWNEIVPHYKHLRYVIFFGLPPIAEITNTFQKVVLTNPPLELSVFQRDETKTPDLPEN